MSDEFRCDDCGHLRIFTETSRNEVCGECFGKDDLRAQLAAVTKELNDLRKAVKPEAYVILSRRELESELDASIVREAALREALAIAKADLEFRPDATHQEVCAANVRAFYRVHRVLKLDPSPGVEFLMAAREWADAEMKQCPPCDLDQSGQDCTCFDDNHAALKEMLLAARRKECG